MVRTQNYSLYNDNLFISKIQPNSRHCFEVVGLVGLFRGRGQGTTSVSHHDVLEHGARRILKLIAGTLPANCCFFNFKYFRTFVWTSTMSYCSVIFAVMFIKKSQSGSDVGFFFQRSHLASQGHAEITAALWRFKRTASAFRLPR